jgi:hypothetical protein
MTAVELLREVQGLPAREWERFFLALLKLEAKPPDAKRKGRQVKWPDIEARAKLIFGKRVFPNLVVLERQEGREGDAQMLDGVKLRPITSTLMLHVYGVHCRVL